MLLCIIPLFAFTVIASGKEVKQMKSLDQVLDKNIDLKDISLVQNSYMYDRDGSLVSEIVSDHENRVLVPFNKIPEEVKQIFLTSEDRHFYEHKGFDFMGMVRATASNVKDKKIDQGASTITQQLSRNLYLSHERSFSRKLTELAYSYQLEKKYTKNEILEASLFGPLLGGMLADRFGFTYTFFITSFVIFSSVLLVLFGVKEKHLAEKTAKRTSYSRKEVLSYIFHHPALWVMMLLTMLIQTGNFSIQPLLALYVNELHGPVNLAFFSGMAFSATGLGSLLLARKWGDLGDRYGHRRILIGLLLAASFFFIPQALAS